MVRRVPLREEHLQLAAQAHKRGELELAGAYGAGFDDESPVVAGACLVFVGPNKTAAEKFAAADPYVKNGLVTKWSVYEWKVVVGKS